MPAAGRPGGPPTDWGSGERVFGPPAGTLDVDWLVPAVLERVLVSPAAAREALERAWRQRVLGAPGRAEAPGADDAQGAADTAEAAEAADTAHTAEAPQTDELAAAADVVLAEALQHYRVDPGQAGRRAD